MISGRDAVKAAVESLGYAYEESVRLSVPVALERPEATGRGHREATTGPDTGKRIRDVIQRHRYNVTDSKWEDLSPAQQSGWAELERHFIASLGIASKVLEEN